MALIEINDLDKLGVIRDIPAYQLAPEAFSLGSNVRAREGAIERIGGHEQVFGTLPEGNDEYTKILLHFDGEDGASTVVDSSIGGAVHSWTGTGMVLDNAEVVFGPTSAKFDGASDWATTADHADFALGTLDFTFDFRFMVNNTGLNICAAGQTDSVQTVANTSFYAGRTNLNVMRFSAFTSAGTVQLLGTNQYTTALNPGMHHYAAVRSGSSFKLYIDGVEEASATSSAAINDSAFALRVGAFGEFAGGGWIGWIDEFRLSVGVARWTAPFDPPPSPYMTLVDSEPDPSRVDYGESEATPHFALPIASVSQTYWLWTSLTKSFVFDGVVHHNITRRATGTDVDYTTDQTRDWNGTLLGGVPILNNGSDVPQYWPDLNPSLTLADLPNWQSTVRAKVIRAFGPYLVGLHITKSAVSYPHMVKWSHPADPGGYPISWDETDPSKDAGEYDLPDAHAGVILDGSTLRDHFFVFKEGSVWRMTSIGGTAIFNFDIFLETAGCLTQRCITYTPDGGKQVFASQDDILMHNGNSAASILDQRMRRYLFNQISTTNYRNCFMFTNPYKGEIWFCYPETGNEHPNRALIWNYRDGQIGAFTEAECRWRNAASGATESDNPDTWATVVPQWDTYTGAWAVSNRRKVVLCGTSQKKFFLMDTGLTFDGAPFTATAQREGLAVEGRKRNGEWIVDYASHKMVTRLWVKLEGGPVNIRMGFEDKVGGAAMITWLPTQVFDPNIRNYVDFTGSGKAIAFEISTTASTHWRLLGYKVELEVISRF